MARYISKEAISNLVASKGIFNGGMEGKKSYYINKHNSFIPSPGVLDNTSECCTEATHSFIPDAEEINNIFEMVVSRKLKELVRAEFNNFKGEEISKID